MPKLLRVHFSGIGHEDARLSPLTLNFRDEKGMPEDSILWLRNGGGKSSIINLFFSLFRPQLSEFLGAKAEGKARRLEQYVKANDLAFVLSEWELEPGTANSEPKICIIGRYLAWRDQRVSTDSSRLRKRFFSYSPGSDAPGFDELPINGLGDEPVPTFVGFREWLATLQSHCPDIGLVDTQNQREWGNHLERLGVDPQLFKYQMKMNEREGAADEAFRFDSSAEFVEFLLELAFDTEQANQVSSNLSRLRDQLAQRPELILEQEFISSALAVLAGLVDVKNLTTLANQELGNSLTQLSETRTALTARSIELSEKQQSAESLCIHWKQLSRERSNERDKHNRWAAGMDRKCLELKVEEHDVRLRNEEADCAEAVRRKQYIQAGIVTQHCNQEEAKLRELQEQLRQEQAELAPERSELELAGTALSDALALEKERQKAVLDDLETRLEIAKSSRQRMNKRVAELGNQEGKIGQQITGLKERIDQRNRARERLVQSKLIAHREDFRDALARWHEEASRIEEKQSILASGTQALDTERESLRLRSTAVSAEKARLEATYEKLSVTISKAMEWQERLVHTPWIADVEGVDEPNIRAEGLVERLTSESSRATNQGIDLKVDGAEDERSLAALCAEGLLPASLDVERCCEILRNQGLNAHTGYRYLAENLPVEERRKLIHTDPLTFSGIIVSAENLPDTMPLLPGSPALRSPIRVSAAGELDLQSSGEPEDRTWLLPSHRAVYDEALALEMRGTLQVAKHKRDRRSLELQARAKGCREAAAQLQQFLTRFGGSLLDQLVQQCETHALAIATAIKEIAECEKSYVSLDKRQVLHRVQIAEAGQLLLSAREAIGQLDHFFREHERQLASRRSEADALKTRLQQLSSERKDIEEALQKAENLQQSLRNDQYELTSSINATTQERAGIAYVLALDSRPDSPSQDVPEPDVTLAIARTRYHERLQRWLGHTASDRLVWEIEQCSKKVEEHTLELGKLCNTLNPDKLDIFSRSHDLESQRTTVLAFIENQRNVVAKASAALDLCKDRLTSMPRRRDASDLPPNQSPVTSKQARQQAELLRQQVVVLVEQCSEAEDQVKTQSEQSQKLSTECATCQRLEDRIVHVVEGADMELPNTVAGILAEDWQSIESDIQRFQDQFQQSRRKLRDAQMQVHDACENVRHIGNSDSFAQLRSQAKERMKGPTEELLASCEHLHRGLEPRLEIIGARLDDLDKDRAILINSLQKIASEVGTLLRRAETSSLMPADLGPWANKPFLRLRFAFPETDEERQIRLQPLVDRLVAKGKIPNGLALICQAVHQLAGSRGFDVKILKPDEILRAEAIPISAMSTFSRGQQLTAAILLYCTLVSLRAQSRGRRRTNRKPDAGILLLDNPIGTCSSVPMIELQRKIAKIMGVQLLYATGVEDLEALDVLPNKIRLRNASRAKGSGDYHVTQERTLAAVHVSFNELQANEQQANEQP